MRQLRPFLIAMCFWLMAGAPAFAEGSQINSEVEVDVTGTDTADAREQAMAKGQADALVDLLGRFTTGDLAQQIVSGMEPRQISAISRGTEVLNEKMSSNRYRATLRVSFDADEISKLVTNSGGTVSAQPAKIGAFLIIPSYEEEGSVLLWDEGNPWRNAWKATGLESTTGDIIVPYGDAADAAVLDVKTLPSATFSSLLTMTVRYGVTDIILLQAKYTQSAGSNILEVVKRRISRNQNEVNVLTYRADLQETKDALMARAAHDIADSLEHKKNEESESVKVVKGGEHSSVMVLASISTLSSWTQLRSKLTGLPMIDKIDTLAVSPQQIDLLIHYRGSTDSLADAIRAQNIRLLQNANYWVISRD